ncbi:MAG: DUF3368 domain-containing protein [Blastocatellia bacterium]|nr:DUF3368 domain-containing protein [Blastocatellia bacterium]
MPNDRVVVNSSPLITLCKSEQEEILLKLFSEIVVPGAVSNEILAAGAADPVAQQLPALNWTRREESIIVPALIQAWDLGAGESEVLSFAVSNPGYLVVIDDMAARRCAKALKIRMIGTIGLFVLAKRKNLIPEAMPHIEKLRNAGLWLADSLIENLRRQLGE